MSLEEAEAAFRGFVSRPGIALACTTGVMVLTGWIVGQGLGRGVELAARWLMPILFCFLAALAAGSATFEGAGAGMVWYLSPDFSAVDGTVVLTALGPVFYSIGVGMAAAWRPFVRWGIPIAVAAVALSSPGRFPRGPSLWRGDGGRAIF